MGFWMSIGEALRILGLMVILLAAARSDLKTYEIPDSVHVAAIFWWLVWLPLEGDSWTFYALGGIAGGAGIAGGLLVLSMIMDRILGKESLGGGDIKLFFVTGLYLGPAGNLFNLMLSCVLGILHGVLLMRLHPETKQPRIPFALATAVSTCFCLLAGDAVIEWYLSLF